MRRCLASLLLFFVYCVSGPDRVVAIEIEEISQLLTARSALAERYEWSFVTTEIQGVRFVELGGNWVEALRVAQGKGLDMVKEKPPFRQSGRVLLDVPTGRYRLLLESVSKWINGAAPTVAFRRNRAFDGKLYSQCTRQQYGTELPPKNFNHSQLADERIGPFVAEFSTTTADSGTISADLFASAIWALPAFIFAPGQTSGRFPSPTDYFSQLNSEHRIKSVIEKSASEWVVSCEVDFTNQKRTVYVDFVFNPTQGGALSRILERDSLEMPPARETFFANEEWSNSLWGPSQVTQYDWVSGFGTRTRISNVVIDPAISDSSFTIELPTGTLVQDHVNKLSYVASAAPPEQAAAMAEYVRMHQLTVPVASDTESTKSTKGRWALYILNSAALLLTTMWLIHRFWLSRKARRHNIVGFFLCALLVFEYPSIADDKLLINEVRAKLQNVAVEKLQWRDGWFVELQGAPVSVSQCGFDTTSVVLSMCSIRFNPQIVARELKPSVKGIHMSDIRKVLESHGVSTIARAGVNLDELVRFLKPGVCAIVAISDPNTGLMHYVVLAPDKRGEVVMIDPPYPPIRISNWTQEAIASFSRVAVLICRRQPPNSGVAESVTVTPGKLQFAPHELENGMFSAKVELVNEGREAVAIAGVNKPCDCVTLQDGWAGIWGPGERRTVFVDVDGRKWGVGRQKRAIDFVSVTGGSFRLIVEGESLADSSRIGRFEMSRHLHVPLNCGQLPVSHNASVKFDAVGPIGVNYRCESQQEWLEGHITDDSKDGGSMIALTATFDESLINRISSGENVCANVEVFAPGETVSRGRIEVAYTRRIDAITSPRVIQLSDGKGECEISIDKSVDDGWELSRIECMDNELDVASRSIAGRLWKIIARAKQTGLPRRAVVVFCVFTKPGEVPVRIQIPIVERN